MTEQKILAIIPARGGSKGVPGKNIKPLLGVPLIGWSIRHALRAKRVTRVVVSTEDDRIATIAERFGAEVIRRPAALAEDTTPTEPVLTHVLDVLRGEDGYEPDLVVLLQPTSPVRHKDRIDAAVDALEVEGYDSLLTVSPLERFIWKQKEDGSATAFYDFENRPRRQDIRDEDRIWAENGNIYVTKAPLLRNRRNRLGGTIGMLKISAEEGVEIDTPADWRECERILQGDLEIIKRLLPDSIQLVVFDFDGVMTDNRVIVNEKGEESVCCHRGDGMGISLLRDLKIAMLVLSSETNPVVSERCRKLQLECIQAVGSKDQVLLDLIRQRGVDPAEVVYVGNDVNDLPAYSVAGCTVAVADAHPALKQKADLILSRPGGKGAVRELCDWILHARTADGKEQP